MQRVLLLFALGLSACYSQAEVGLPRVAGSELRVLPGEDGPWKPLDAHEEIRGPWQVAHGGFEAVSDEPAGAGTDPFAVESAPAPPVANARGAGPGPVVPVGPKLAVLARRARVEARPVGAQTRKSPAQLAREHFLDYPTRVRAARVTLYVPPAFAREVRLRGERVDRSRPARQQAFGEARLLLRELTLEGDRVVLRIRQDGIPDIQIMARGGVEFVSDVRGNILRERGLKSLLITNDQVVPIR